MPYRIVLTRGFTRDLKLLKKTYKGKRDRIEFEKQITQIVQELKYEPRPFHAPLEPWPSKSASEGWEFRKLKFAPYRRRGGAGEGRIMYCVNASEQRVRLIYLYTHEQYSKRPPDKEIRDRLGEEL